MRLQPIPIPPLTPPPPVLHLFQLAHKAAAHLPPPQSTAAGTSKMIATYTQFGNVIAKNASRLPPANGFTASSHPTLNGLKRERDDDHTDEFNPRKRQDIGDRKISPTPLTGEPIRPQNEMANGVTFSSNLHNGPMGGQPMVAGTSATSTIAPDHDQPQQLLSHHPSQSHFTHSSSPTSLHNPLRQSPTHNTVPQHSSPLAISQQSMQLQQGQPPQQPPGSMLAPQQQQDALQFQIRRQQQALLMQQRGLQNGGGGLPPQASQAQVNGNMGQPMQPAMGPGGPGGASNGQIPPALLQQAIHTLRNGGANHPVIQHLMKVNPGFSQLPFQQQVQQLTSLQVRFSICRRRIARRLLFIVDGSLTTKSTASPGSTSRKLARRRRAAV